MMLVDHYPLNRVLSTRTERFAQCAQMANLERASRNISLLSTKPNKNLLLQHLFENFLQSTVRKQTQVRVEHAQLGREHLLAHDEPENEGLLRFRSNRLFKILCVRSSCVFNVTINSLVFGLNGANFVLLFYY